MIQIILLLIIAYLLGSIPSGYWIGMKFFGIDIREQGSGNIGTTNTFRVLGGKAGTAVLIADILKGTLATLLPIWFHVQGVSPLIFGLMAVIGHTYSIFIKFKGGKAVATSGGILLGFAPTFFVYIILIFLITLYLTSMVSFSSLTASVFAVIGIVFFPIFHVPILPNRDWLFTVILLILVSFIAYRHRENVERIRHRKENTIRFGKNLLGMPQKNKN